MGNKQRTARKRAAASWSDGGRAPTHSTALLGDPAAASMPMRVSGAFKGSDDTWTPPPAHSATTRRPSSTPRGAQPPTRAHLATGWSEDVGSPAVPPPPLPSSSSSPVLPAAPLPAAAASAVASAAAAVPGTDAESMGGGECDAIVTTVAPGEVPLDGRFGNTTTTDDCVARNNVCWCHSGVANPSCWWLTWHKYLQRRTRAKRRERVAREHTAQCHTWHSLQLQTD